MTTAQKIVPIILDTAPPEEVCPICKGAGYVGRDNAVGHPDFGRLWPCICISEKLAAKRLKAAHVSAGLPPDLREMTFDNFLPGQAAHPKMPPPQSKTDAARRARERIHRLRNHPGGLQAHMKAAKVHCLEFARKPQGFLTLIGDVGCGKSHLAAAIANYRLLQGDVVQFSVVPDLLDHLRATFSDESRVTYDTRFEAYKTCPLLVLDDLGTESRTSWVLEKLYQLINHRYNWRLPLVVTSNDLPTDLDERIMSRLFDQRRNSVFDILAGDYRLRRC